MKNNRKEKSTPKSLKKHSAHTNIINIIFHGKYLEHKTLYNLYARQAEV